MINAALARTTRLLTTAMGLVLIVAISCVTPSGPGFASSDGKFFAERPTIVRRPASTVIQWTYGESGLIFFHDYRVVDGRLVVSLRATTSTGSRRGRIGEQPIVEAEALRALDAGGAWWWEPDGSQTPLRVVDERGQH